LSDVKTRRGRTRLLAILAVAAVAMLCIRWLRKEDASQGDAAVAEHEPAAAMDLVQRGEYLARIGNCISCHTRHGGEAFAGGMSFGAPYASLGTLYSTNITPDRTTGIGGWKEQQFVRAMHEGRAPDHGRLFPAFPYNYFSRVTDDDAKAIFAYLRTVKPVRYTPPANSAAFTLRSGMALWNASFFKEGRFNPDTTQSAEWNRGAYLVNGLGHCGACHTPRNVFLAEKADAALSGSTYPESAASGKRQNWAAVNLTSASSGLGAWTVDDIKKYLKTGHSRRAGIFGPMNEVIANSLQYLTDDDAKAMAVYLKSLPPLNESPDNAIDSGHVQAGAPVYAEHCEKCHMSSGRGAFLKAPPVAGSAVAQARDPATLITVILHGAKVGAGGPAPFGAWEDMPSFADKLTDDQTAAVSNYVRGTWGNRGGMVTAQEVKNQR